MRLAQTTGAPTEQRYERPADAIRRTRISRSKFYELVWSGAIPSYRVGRAVLIPAGAVDEFLARQGSAAKVLDR